jgi:hypothetical protein
MNLTALPIFGGTMKKTVSIIGLTMIFALSLTLTAFAQIKAPLKTSPGNVKAVKPIDMNQASTGINAVNTYELTVKDYVPYWPAIARLGNGEIFTVWEEVLLDTNKHAGVATLWTEDMQGTGKWVYYTEFMPELSIGKNQVIPFSDGNVLVIYENQKDYRTRFIIFNNKFHLTKGPILINESATRMSATLLAGGKLALVAFYSKDGIPANAGKYSIINSTGDIVVPPTVFTTKGRIDALSAALMPDGLVVISYALGFGRTIVIDQTGNVIRPETVFYPNAASCLTAIPLDNGNIMVIFQNKDLTPVCQIIDSQGKNVGSAIVLHDKAASGTRAVKLKNGNILVGFIDSGSSATGLALTMLDQTGKTTKGPSRVLDGWNLEYNHFDMMAVKQDMALIIHGAYRHPGGQTYEKRNGFLLVK